jgi:hypothetical protein
MPRRLTELEQSEGKVCGRGRGGLADHGEGLGRERAEGRAGA